MLLEPLEERALPSFLAPLNFPAGSRPFSMALGEFNGDGLPDLAVTIGAGGVSVLLGNGDGTFQAPRSFAVGNRSESVAVGEFNGDGLSDLAVATHYPSDSVSVLLGNGNGTFEAARNFAAGSGPFSVAVGEFNGDSLTDLAVANINSNNISVLLGNGDGTFQAAQNFAAGSSPFSVAVGEFNGDGWPDLAVANAGSNDVSILLNAADDAAFFYLDAPAAVPAGHPLDLTVYALSGDWQRLAHGYRGTVALWSSDEAATLPAPYTFRAEDYGVASFPGGVTLRTPGVQYLAAFDLETFTIIGYAVVDVLGAAPGSPPARGPVLDFFLAEVLAGGPKPRR